MPGPPIWPVPYTILQYIGEHMKASLVHRHHDVFPRRGPDESGVRPESELEWVWHAHEHEPSHVDTTAIERLDGTGHPLDVTVPTDDPVIKAEIERQMREFARRRR